LRAWHSSCLLLDTAWSGVAVKPVGIAELRRLAEAKPGKPPQSVRYELIAQRRIVGTSPTAVSGLRSRVISDWRCTEGCDKAPRIAPLAVPPRSGWIS